MWKQVSLYKHGTTAYAHIYVNMKYDPRWAGNYAPKLISSQQSALSSSIILGTITIGCDNNYSLPLVNLGKISLLPLISIGCVSLSIDWHLVICQSPHPTVNGSLFFLFPDPQFEYWAPIKEVTNIVEPLALGACSDYVSYLLREVLLTLAA